MGRRFSIAISCARRFFLAVIGNQAPALTVASLATTTHCLPETYPIPHTTPPDGQPPCSAYIPSPTKAPISSQGLSSSIKYATRSRASIFPFSFCLAAAFSPPPAYTFFKRLFSSKTSCLLMSSFLLNSRFMCHYKKCNFREIKRGKSMRSAFCYRSLLPVIHTEIVGASLYRRY